MPVQVDVIDNGCGIPDDIRDHLFDPFVSERSGGSGLGLTMVASVVADHGGMIGGGFSCWSTGLSNEFSGG